MTRTKEKERRKGGGRKTGEGQKDKNSEGGRKERQEQDCS